VAHGCLWNVNHCVSGIPLTYELYTGTGYNDSTSPWSIINPTNKINLNDFPTGAGCFYALLNLHSIYNTVPIDVNFTFKRETGETIYTHTETIPVPPAGQYWDWYSTVAWAVKDEYEVNSGGRYTCDICLTGDITGCETTHMDVTGFDIDKILPIALIGIGAVAVLYGLSQRGNTK